MNFARTKKAAEMRSSPAPESARMSGSGVELVFMEQRGAPQMHRQSPRRSLGAPILLKRGGAGRKDLRRLFASFLTSKSQLLELSTYTNNISAGILLYSRHSSDKMSPTVTI